LNLTFSDVLLFSLKPLSSLLSQGNVTVWKPSDTAVLSNYLIYKIFKEAGFPDGVVNFVPADGPVFGQAVSASRDLAAVNFTGSVP
jgi:1-pyrroline-5-carboxylate dehydrogenase